MINIFYFYALWDNYSCAQRKQFVDSMKEIKGIKYDLFDIGENEEKWLEYGLKTVPGVVVMNGKSVVGFFAGSINWNSVKSFIIEQKAYDLSGVIYAIEEYNVLWSSSCHRYDRWNEQLINMDGYNTGWSSVSNERNGYATLIVDFYKPHRLKEIGIIPRKWDFNKDLKDSFPDVIRLDISMNGTEWTDIGEYYIEDKNEANEKRIAILPVDCRYIKLMFTVKNLRLEKKFFVQLIKLNFYAEYSKQNINKKAQPSFGKIDKEIDFLTNIVNKRGVSHGKSSTVSFWFLNKGQNISKRCFYDTQVLFIPLNGEIVVCWDDKEKIITNGEWVKIPRKCVCEMKNKSDHKCSLIEVIEKTPSYCAWSLRK